VCKPKPTIASSLQMGVKIKLVTGDQIASHEKPRNNWDWATNILDASALGDLKKDATPEQAKAIGRRGWLCAGLPRTQVSHY